jgi:hypothetical protein
VCSEEVPKEWPVHEVLPLHKYCFAPYTAPKIDAKTEANLKMKELQIYSDKIDQAISMKANDLMGLKDLKNIFPCDVDLKNIPCMHVRSSNDVESKLKIMSERALPTLITFFHHIVRKVAEVLLPEKPSFIIERLYSVALSPIVLGYSIALKQVFVLKMATSIFQLANSMSRNTTAYRVVGAIIAAGGNQRELEIFFADMELPKLGRDARRRRQEDLNGCSRLSPILCPLSARWVESTMNSFGRWCMIFFHPTTCIFLP